MTRAIRIENVSKRFRLYKERNFSLKSALVKRHRSRYEEFWALNEVDLSIEVGETFGLIGSNGSGKSTLLKLIARILTPDSGSIVCAGRVSSLLEVGSGFHPELSGRENIFLNGSILGMGRKEIRSKFDEIVEFSGVEMFLEQPIKNYSSGMFVRLGFSIAIHTNPDILLVDEILSVGDGAFQEKSKSKFLEFARDGRTIVFVSHSLDQVREICQNVAWLDLGQIKAIGNSVEITRRYEGAILAEQDDS